MNKTLTPEAKQQLETGGSIMSQMPSGIPKIRYYTPDGREESKVPQYHTRQDGVVYDIFLAQGYTLTPPENPKPHCSGCNGWHDTEEQVKACIKERKRFMTTMNRKARQDLAKERKGKDNEIADLKARLKALEAKLG